MKLTWSEATVVALLAAAVPVILTWLGEWIRAYRRRETVRRALLVEVQRIREELGGGRGVVPDETDGSIWSSTPSVHPWMHSVIVEAADISPTIVAAFLELDRRLTALAMQLEAARTALRVRNERHHRLVTVRNRLDALEGQPSPDERESLGDLLQQEHGLSADETLTNAKMQAEWHELLQRRSEGLTQVDALAALLKGCETAPIAPPLTSAPSPEVLAVVRREMETRE